VVHGSVLLSGGSTVGANSRVAADAVVDGSILFDDAAVGRGAVVRRSVVGFGARIGDGAVIEDAVIGDRASIGARVELRAGARVWPEVVLADGAIRFSADL
ncbi:MAG: NDP-sugar synthase, partial [Actinomycetota bacterium]|nr:NDP-sugar synthase [Actinomycetota bacterium]